MQGNIVSAVFDSRAEAERAIQEMRLAGADNDSISIVGKHDGEMVDETGVAGETTGHSDEPTSFIAKAAAGSGIGALLGVAALAIPGVGPLAAAGAIAAAAVPGAALTGTAIGAAAGGVSDLFSSHGVSREDADYYGQHVERGGIFVSVDTQRSGLDRDRAEDILSRAGGHSSSRAKLGMNDDASTTTNTY
jgi:hypothetical protein